MIRTLPRLATVGLALAALIAGASAPASAVPRRDVGDLLDSRVKDHRIGRDVAGIVIDAATGEVIWSHGAARGMQPASNMKVVTAFTALARLGTGHRFPTTVVRGRTPKDVILQAGGDPLLRRDDLRTLARRTAAALPVRATVVLHVDGDIFSRPTMAPGWVAGYLGVPVGYVQALTLRGDRSRTPSKRAAEAFADELRKRGLHVRIGANQDAAPDAERLAVFRGHRLRTAIAVMLSTSDSSIAEMLFRHVAIAAGRPATWQGSRRAARETLLEMGVDPGDSVLADGSGLSRKDRISPAFLARLLRIAAIEQPSRFAAIFRPTAMPVAGRTGTLGTRFGRYSTAPSACARGRVQAKTGTIMGTIALSGIARSTRGRRIFSIIVNHRPTGYSALSTRRALDGLAATIVGCWR